MQYIKGAMFYQDNLSYCYKMEKNNHILLPIRYDKATGFSNTTIDNDLLYPNLSPGSFKIHRSSTTHNIWMSKIRNKHKHNMSISDTINTLNSKIINNV